MKRVTIAAIAAIAMAIPYFATAQDDPAKIAAIATAKAKLAAVVDGSGAPKPNPCVVIDAADYSPSPIQEVACDGGLSYMIFPGAQGPQAMECAQAASDADEKGDLIVACRLPENRDALKVIDKALTDAKTPCTPVARSYVGESNTGSSVYFEVTCDNAKGYLVQVWKDPVDVKAFGNKPWICDDSFRSRGNDCTLTKLGVSGAKAAETKRVALLDAYFNPKKGAAPPPMQAPPSAAAPTGPAAPAAGGGGATALTGPLPAADTKAVADSGLTCPMNPPKLRDDSDDQLIVEFRCTSKDDGRLGVFSKKPGVAPLVYNCANVVMVGVKCLDTAEKAGYTGISADIRRVASGQFGGDCIVSQIRLIGGNGKTASIEVKCTDPRIGGEVIQYNMLNNKPIGMTLCSALAAQITAGATCTLIGSSR